MAALAVKIVRRFLEALGYSIVKLPPPVQRHDRVQRAETTAKPIDLTGAVTAFRTNGYAVIRNVLPKDRIAEYSRRTSDWFDDLDARLDAGGVNDQLAVYAKQSGICLSPGVETQTKPPPGVQEFAYMLCDSGLWNAGFFPEEMAALIELCSIRRQKPGEPAKALDFHQDGLVVYRNEPPSEGLVFWIPLTPIDEQTPGLELVEGTTGYFPHGGNQENSYLESTAPVNGERISVGNMQLGDVLVFSLATPHRTQLHEGMTKTRFSIDVRAVPISRIPKNYKGLAFILR